jgi:uncharacterized protein (TIGR03437 family)
MGTIARTSFWALMLGLAAAGPAPSQTISTAAGSTAWGGPADVALDGNGNMYVADWYKSLVYKVDRFAASTIVAGTGTAGYSGDGGPATSAKLSGPIATAVDAAGNLYIAEYDGQRIRKVSPNGTITTFAGTGRGGFSGDGGQATSATIYYPLDLLLDSSGNLLFVDGGNNRIRKVSTSGVISTIAGTGRRSSSGDGGPALAADMFPTAFAWGPDGSLYFTDSGFRNASTTPKVRKILPNGTVAPVAGNGQRAYAGDGGPATAASFLTTDGVAVDASGVVYISDFSNCRIRKVALSGIITTFAGGNGCGLTGDGGDPTNARVNGALGLVIDAGGDLLFADYYNQRIRKISAPPAPTIRTSDAGLPSFMGKAGFSSNMYLEIYGNTLSQTQRLWAGSDFQGANAPTSLDDVSVTVNGKPAFIYYISPTQININTPEDSATGPVQVQVKTPLGFSNSVTLNRSRVSPALQTVPQFALGGKQYVVAQTSDFQSFIGSPNMIQGLSFTPARPGQTVLIYALGCGPTNPATHAGVVASQNSALTLPFELRIGGVAASVPFAGVVANTIGLYQFNVVIPNVAAGDQPIELLVDGVSNSQNLVITVGQ